MIAGTGVRACPQAAHSLARNDGDLKNRNKEQIWATVAWARQDSGFAFLNSSGLPFLTGPWKWLPTDGCGERKPDGRARGHGGLFRNSSLWENTRSSCRRRGSPAHRAPTLILQAPQEGLAYSCTVVALHQGAQSRCGTPQSSLLRRY